MTDWEPGDEFDLKHSGTVRNIFDGLIEVRHEGFLGPNFYQQEWFDSHATKIHRPFQFGDKVEVINPTSMSAGQQGVVVDPRPKGMNAGLDVWLKGSSRQRWFGNGELRLINLQGGE